MRFRSILSFLFVVVATVVATAAPESEVITLGKSAQQVIYSGPTPVDAPGTIHVTLGDCVFDSSLGMTNCVLSGPATDGDGDITAYQFVESYAGNGPSPMTGTLNPDGTFTAHANGATNTSDFFGGDGDDPDPFNTYLNFGDIKGQATNDRNKRWTFVMNTTNPAPSDIALLNCGGLATLPCNLFDVAQTPGAGLVTFVFNGTQAPMPEPGSLALLCSGVMAALWISRPGRLN